mmetsp:Transcript_31324/g.47367  ORF Transcript_31324/g.47367 Transcript_31324/m.47367 type:complete len:177 (+) Transcript_31324:126-656(+)
MGGIFSNCTDPNEESNKQKHKNGDVFQPVQGDELASDTTAKALLQNANNNESRGNGIPDESAELRRLQKEEEERLQLIVSTAGRDMVSIQSTRGATYYHDQGFAAGLSQLLQKTLPTTHSHPKLPKPADSENILGLLVSPVKVEETPLWEMAVVNEATTTKEQLFAKCPQIVENLL